MSALLLFWYSGTWTKSGSLPPEGRGGVASGGSRLRGDGAVGWEVLRRGGEDQLAAVLGGAAGEVVVGAGVVVVDSVMHRADEGEAVCLFGEERQVVADVQAGDA